MPIQPQQPVIELSDFTMGWQPDLQDETQQITALTDALNLIPDVATTTPQTREGFQRILATLTDTEGDIIQGYSVETLRPFTYHHDLTVLEGSGEVGVSETHYLVAVLTNHSDNTPNNILILAINLDLPETAPITERCYRIDDVGRSWVYADAHHWGKVIDNTYYGGGRADDMYCWDPSKSAEKQWDPECSLPDYPERLEDWDLDGNKLGTNEVQTITLPQNCTGNWRIGFHKRKDGRIKYSEELGVNEDGNDVEDAMVYVKNHNKANRKGIPDIKKDDIKVTGPNGGPYEITFKGKYQRQDMPKLIIDDVALVCANEDDEVTVEETTKGETIYAHYFAFRTGQKVLWELDNEAYAVADRTPKMNREDDEKAPQGGLRFKRWTAKKKGETDKGKDNNEQNPTKDADKKGNAKEQKSKQYKPGDKVNYWDDWVNYKLWPDSQPAEFVRAFECKIKHTPSKKNAPSEENRMPARSEEQKLIIRAHGGWFGARLGRDGQHLRIRGEQRFTEPPEPQIPQPILDPDTGLPKYKWDPRIPWNVTKEQLQEALERLDDIGDGNVEVFDDKDNDLNEVQRIVVEATHGHFRMEWDDKLAHKDIPNPAFIDDMTTPGVPPLIEKHRIYWLPTLTAQDLQDYLEGIDRLEGNVTVAERLTDTTNHIQHLRIRGDIGWFKASIADEGIMVGTNTNQNAARIPANVTEAELEGAFLELGYIVEDTRVAISGDTKGWHHTLVFDSSHMGEIPLIKITNDEHIEVDSGGAGNPDRPGAVNVRTVTVGEGKRIFNVEFINDLAGRNVPKIQLHTENLKNKRPEHHVGHWNPRLAWVTTIKQPDKGTHRVFTIEYKGEMEHMHVPLLFTTDEQHLDGHHRHRNRGRNRGPNGNRDRDRDHEQHGTARCRRTRAGQPEGWRFWRSMELGPCRDEDGEVNIDWDRIQTAPQSNIAEWHANRMWIPDEHTRDLLAYSAPSKPKKYDDDGEFRWQPKNWKIGDNEQGDQGGFQPFKGEDDMTALYSYGQHLLVFKRQSLWALSGWSEDTWTVRRIDSYGCAGPRAFVEHDGLVYFLSEQGFYYTDGTQCQEVPGGEYFRDWLRDVLDWDKIQPDIDLFSWRGYIWLSVPVEGKPDRTIVYDPILKSLWPTNLAISAVCTQVSNKPARPNGEFNDRIPQLYFAKPTLTDAEWAYDSITIDGDERVTVAFKPELNKKDITNLFKQPGFERRPKDDAPNKKYYDAFDDLGKVRKNSPWEETTPRKTRFAYSTAAARFGHLGARVTNKRKRHNRENYWDWCTDITKDGEDLGEKEMPSPGHFHKVPPDFNVPNIPSSFHVPFEGIFQSFKDTPTEDMPEDVTEMTISGYFRHPKWKKGRKKVSFKDVRFFVGTDKTEVDDETDPDNDGTLFDEEDDPNYSNRQNGDQIILPKRAHRYKYKGNGWYFVRAEYEPDPDNNRPHGFVVAVDSTLHADNMYCGPKVDDDNDNGGPPDPVVDGELYGRGSLYPLVFKMGAPVEGTEEQFDDDNEDVVPHANPIGFLLATAWLSFGVLREERRIRRQWALIHTTSAITTRGFMNYRENFEWQTDYRPETVDRALHFEGKWAADAHAILMEVSGLGYAAILGCAYQTEPRRIRYGTNPEFETDYVEVNVNP
jgi:hypothetical protein